MIHWMSRAFALGLLSLAGLTLGGCATGTNPADPYEGFNRSMYSFNKGLDKAVLRPLAKGYDTVTPKPLQDGVGNFFSNLNELPTILNDLLQAKFAQAGSDSGRFLINSTFGLAGLIDVASRSGLERHDEDFAQTLGYWGVGSGPYLMLPFLGPSTPRDVFGKALLGPLDPVGYIDHVPTRNSLFALRIIDGRAQLFPLDKQLEEALDEYIFVRDAYLQHREYLIKDGKVPEQKTECESEDPADCAENW